MISCMILHHLTITSLTKCKILRFIFKDHDFEIEVRGNNTVMVFVYNAEKMEIWQAAIAFETTNIIVGYGFAKEKSEARIQAEQMIITLLSFVEEKELHPQLYY
ncbi:hypothetical protein PD280_00150 [Virgibacillus salarius]|uniref:hypothetical protein n=1 Tax=Virgibacillus salarius TaxID=447199 RepID=UPI002492F206|nr:hypothetical protein [Virgibacillus salarius]WBX80359.1 hypothetical protein PD280_00150 [Virgibacillus salarius]